jgi:hypothetical protein
LLHLLGGLLRKLCSGAGLSSPRRQSGSETNIATPGSDSSRMRAILRAMFGRDNKKYQLQLQIECAEILRQPQTWAAIKQLARELHRKGMVTGERAVEIFRAAEVPDYVYRKYIIGKTDVNHENDLSTPGDLSLRSGQSVDNSRNETL